MAGALGAQSDGDVDAVDFLGFDYLMRNALGRDQGEDKEDADTSEDEIQ